MGRPLNKKYFGNRNIGTTSTGDDGLGGNRVSSITVGTPGVYTTRATATFSDPDLLGAGAVRATGTVTMEALAVTVNAGGAGYDVGDLITVTGAGGLIARVATVDDDPIEGVVLTLDFTGGSRGEQTVLTGLTTGVATTNNGGGDNALTVDVTYRVKAVVITEPGSGYADATDAAVTFSNGAGGAGDRALGTTVLESYTVGGAIGNNENAIVTFAYHTGGSLLQGDIVKQVSRDRYKVENATTTAIAKLKSTIANGAGEMNIVATDVDGGTYYVTKLSGHRATLVPAAVARLSSSAGTVFASGTSAPWKFVAAATGYVQIENA